VAQVAVCSQIHTKHVNTVWADCRIVECETGGTYSNHWDVKYYIYYKNQSVNAV